jgi:hypothetical protein
MGGYEVKLSLATIASTAILMSSAVQAREPFYHSSTTISYGIERGICGHDTAHGIGRLVEDLKVWPAEVESNLRAADKYILSFANHIRFRDDDGALIGQADYRSHFVRTANDDEQAVETVHIICTETGAVDDQLVCKFRWDDAGQITQYECN